MLSFDKLVRLKENDDDDVDYQGVKKSCHHFSNEEQLKFTRDWAKIVLPKKESFKPHSDRSGLIKKYLALLFVKCNLRM